MVDIYKRSLKMALKINPLGDIDFLKRKTEVLNESVDMKKIFEELAQREMRFITPSDVYFTLAESTDDGFHEIIFPDAADNFTEGSNLHVPEKWQGKQLLFKIYWFGTAAAGNVVWQIELFTANPGQAYGSQTLTFAADANAGNLLLNIAEKKVTLNLKKDAILGFQIGRMGTDVADTLAANAKFLMLSIEEL